MPQCLFFKKNEKGGATLIRDEVQSKIESLKYTTDETKAIYLQQLAECNASSEFQELVKVIDAGEHQLFEIQKRMFQTLESYIWKINELKYLSMTDKSKWVEKLIVCNFTEEMSEIYAKAVEAEKKASQNSSGSWTVLKE